MEAPRPLDEEAALGRHRRVRRLARGAGEEVGEGAPLGAGRVAPLERLVELLGIAEEHERAAGRRDGDRVGEAELAGLVDEEDVDAPRHGGRRTRARPCPRRRGGSRRASAAGDRSRASPSGSACGAGRRLVLAGFWPMAMRPPAAVVAPVSRAASTTASSTLPITLWLLAVTPTVFPAATRARIMRAPVYVLPVPGGPWIASVLPSRARTRRTAASSAVSSPARSGDPGARPAIRGRPPQEQLPRGAVRVRRRRARGRRPLLAPPSRPMRSSESSITVVRTKSYGMSEAGVPRASSVAVR